MHAWTAVQANISSAAHVPDGPCSGSGVSTLDEAPLTGSAYDKAVQRVSTLTPGGVCFLSPDPYLIPGINVTFGSDNAASGGWAVLPVIS